MFGSDLEAPGHSEISEYVLKLPDSQLPMENLYRIFRSFFCLNFTKMCSRLIFCHGKLSMRTFFTHVAIKDQNLFYFLTLITLMIAHSAMSRNTSYILRLYISIYDQL